MIKIFGIILALGCFLTNCSTGTKEDVNSTVELQENEKNIDFVLDASNSSIDWSGDMLKIYSHSGSLNFVEGKITMNAGVIVSGDFLVNLNSIEALDENFTENPGNSRSDLITHLKSKDFFEVDKYPTASFVFKSMEKNKLTGVLEIKGVQKEITIENIELYPSADDISATMEFTFNRQDFGINYSTGMTDRVISDDVKVLVKIVCLKQLD